MNDADKELIKNSGIVFACKKGMKPESPNQDDFSIHFYDKPDGTSLRIYGV